MESFEEGILNNSENPESKKVRLFHKSFTADFEEAGLQIPTLEDINKAINERNSHANGQDYELEVGGVKVNIPSGMNFDWEIAEKIFETLLMSKKRNL